MAMREYIKLFETPESGNGFKINDIPWIATVKTTGQNLLCNEHNRKTVNNDGILEITEADTIFYLLDGTEIIFTGDTISSEDISEYRDDIVSIELCRTTKNIGVQAFAACQSLTSVTIGEGITNLTFGVFANCPNLINVKLPDSLIALGGEQFFGGGAFQGCTSLKRVEFGDNLKNVGESVFSGCTSLGRIDLPNTVETIGKYAFAGCTNLQSIKLPDSLKTIGSCAFSDCVNLHSVKFNNSIEELGHGIFSGCTNLPVINGIRYADDKYLVEVVDKTRNYYEMLDTTKWIEEKAFAYCEFMETIKIPTSVTDIWASAFQDCRSLLGVYVTNIVSWCNINFDGYDSNPLTYAHSLYLNDVLVNNLVIPSDVNSIKNYSFVYCFPIETVSIPNSVTSIGSYAFSDCTGLTNIEIGSGVTSIGDSAFSYCSGLTSIIIPDGVKNIKNGAFFSCTSLVNVEIGSGVTSVAGNAFQYCNSLPVYNNIRYADTVLVEVVDKTLDNYVMDNDTKFISDYAFKDCAAITSITIPDGVISIGLYAFQNCTSLLDVTIPDSVISISQYAFSNCSSLPVQDDLQYAGTYLIGTVSGINTYYEVRDGTTWIGISAFEYNTSIDTIVLPNTIKIIDSSAFAGLSTINVNIPYGVREIRSGAFDTNSSDENNTYLNVPETVIEIGGGAFNGIGTVVINKLYPWENKIFGYHMDEWPNTRCVAFVNVDETTFAGDFNVSSLFNLGSMKDVRTYNIYTNNQTIIDQLIEASDDYTIFNISPLE